MAVTPPAIVSTLSLPLGLEEFCLIEWKVEQNLAGSGRAPMLLTLRSLP
jgi:hypothetical protein